MLAALVAVALVPPSAAALDGDADEALEHGKLSVADATPIGEGATEVALSWTPTWNQPGSRGFDRLAAGSAQTVSLSLARGLSDDVDVALLGSVASASEALHDFDPADGVVAGPARGTGPGDCTLAARWRFLSRRALDVAVVAGLTAPTGARASPDRVGLTQGHWSAQASVVASTDVGRLTANLELGHQRPVAGDAGGARGVWTAGAGLGWQVTRWLQPTVEVTWRHGLLTGEPDERCVAAALGAVLPLGDRLGVSAGLQQEIWGRHTGQHLTATAAVKTSF